MNNKEIRHKGALPETTGNSLKSSGDEQEHGCRQCQDSIRYGAHWSWSTCKVCYTALLRKSSSVLEYSWALSGSAVRITSMPYW